MTPKENLSLFVTKQEDRLHISLSNKCYDPIIINEIYVSILNKEGIVIQNLYHEKKEFLLPYLKSFMKFFDLNFSEKKYNDADLLIEIYQPSNIIKSQIPLKTL